jgi:hypothetical protein
MTREEEIHYDLAYWGDSEEMEIAIVRTIAKLPEEVAGFAVEECCYLSVGRSCLGMVLPGDIGKEKWIILLDERISKRDLHGAIAHEIAHAWLKHDRTSPDCPVDCEVQAATLTKAWGFAGKGADVEYCNRDMQPTVSQ